PGGEASDAAAESRLAIGVFEHIDVRIGDFAVAVDCGIGKAGEHLVVAGVGEFFAVGYPAGRAAIGVAEDLATFGDAAPDERPKDFAALFARRSPKCLLRGWHVGHTAVVFCDKRFFSAAEEFLPAKAVPGDEDDVFC